MFVVIIGTFFDKLRSHVSQVQLGDREQAPDRSFVFVEESTEDESQERLLRADENQ